MKLTYEEVRNILPHRYPFIMVDKIVELEAGNKAVGIKNVSGNEPFFQGHFPSEAVMPGVLQVEAVGQVGAVAVLIDQERGANAFLAGIKKARFHKKIVPGDQLEIHCAINKRVGNIGFGEGYILVDGEKAMSCEISFAIM